MELSAEVLTGLEAAGSTAALKEDTFKVILSHSLQTVVDPESAKLSGMARHTLCQLTVIRAHIILYMFPCRHG